MRTVNLEQLKAFAPFMPEATIHGLMHGHEQLSMLDIAKAEHVKASDRFWVLLKMLTAGEQQEFACRIADTCLWSERKAGREPDLRSWGAIDAKRSWLRGEIPDATLCASGCAALAAARCWLPGAAANAAFAAAATAEIKNGYRSSRAAAYMATHTGPSFDAYGSLPIMQLAHMIEILLDLVGIQLHR